MLIENDGNWASVKVGNEPEDSMIYFVYISILALIVSQMFLFAVLPDPVLRNTSYWNGWQLKYPLSNTILAELLKTRPSEAAIVGTAPPHDFVSKISKYTYIIFSLE